MDTSVVAFGSLRGVCRFGGFEQGEGHDRRPRLALSADDRDLSCVVGGVEKPSKLVACLADAHGFPPRHVADRTVGTDGTMCTDNAKGGEEA